MKRLVVRDIRIGPEENKFTLFNKIRKRHTRSFFMEFASFKSSEQHRFSLMVFDPSKELIVLKDKVIMEGRGRQITTYVDVDPLDVLRNESRAFELENANAFDIPFKGGVIGYLAYDYYSSYINKAVGSAKKDRIGIPAAMLLFVERYLLYNHDKKTLEFYGIADGGEPAENVEKEALEIEKYLEDVGQEELRRFDDLEQCDRLPTYETNMTKSAYLNMIERAKDYLGRGEADQVVLSQRYELPYKGDGFYMFYVLNRINVSPYMYFLDFGDFSIIGSSPETHCRSKNGKIELNILGGTQRRGGDEEEDRVIRDRLKASSVSTSEHLMLVACDKEEFGVVAEEGSIRVRDTLDNVKYGYTQYLSSVLEGKLKSGYDIYDVIRLTFPRGVVVGTPKERAMQIISELEPESRSYYAGVILCLGYDRRDMDVAITIITSLLKDGRIYVQCGGGILKDSDADEEYSATLYKAMAHIRAACSVQKLIRGESH